MAGLKTRPALQPQSRMSESVRSTCSDASGWNEMMLAPGLGEIRDDAIDGLHHQVHIDRCCRHAPHRLTDHRSDGEVGHVVVVHHVEVDDVRAGREDVRDLLSKTREIGREDAGSDAVHGKASKGNARILNGAVERACAFGWNTVMDPQKNYEITVTAVAQYVADQSDEVEGRYVFAYTITIRNTGNVAAKLLSRHWVITDATNKTQEVRGEGVVGEQPFLRPGESFEYTSGAAILTPVGTMRGSYQMQARTAPHSKRRSRNSSCRCPACCIDRSRIVWTIPRRL